MKFVQNSRLTNSYWYIRYIFGNEILKLNIHLRNIRLIRYRLLNFIPLRAIFVNRRILCNLSVTSVLDSHIFSKSGFSTQFVGKKDFWRRISLYCAFELIFLKYFKSIMIRILKVSNLFFEFYCVIFMEIWQ